MNNYQVLGSMLKLSNQKKGSTLRKVSLFVMLIFITLSCRVKLVPDYSADLVDQGTGIAKTVDQLFLEILENTEAGHKSRAYSRFSQRYIEIEVELKSTLTKNRLRPLNDHAIRNCEILLEAFQKYRNEHKEEDVNYSDGSIKINRKYMDDFFFAYLAAQKALENQN